MVLCCIVLYCIILYHVILCCIISYHIMQAGDADLPTLRKPGRPARAKARPRLRLPWLISFIVILTAIVKDSKNKW